VILTTSRQMRERANCPQSMLIPSSRLNKLELALIDICRTYKLQLNPGLFTRWSLRTVLQQFNLVVTEKFLSVCGKCGGEIESCDADDKRYAVALD
jgi:hypothetical protein